MIPSTAAAMTPPHQVVAVVPVKRLVLAKSRIALPPDQRRELALAFAVDTISSLSASPLVCGVLVVTSDPVVARRVQRLGVRVAPEQGTGLGSAVGSGIRAATAWSPGCGVAVVPADLPCLRPDDVTRVLADPRAAEAAFVPDRSGSGTTLLVHPPGCRAIAHYGPGSAGRHQCLGLHRLDDAPLRARHDVDTLDDLRAARALGPGPQTAAVLHALDGRVDQHAL